MPRSRIGLKKKNKQTGVDFKKYRHKLGRKLPPPSNATNTQIKFKAISLHEQSLVGNKEGSLVNKKGRTLPELLLQTKHFSPKSRKGALIGLRDLAVHHMEEFKLHKTVVIEALVLLISDADKSVRVALHSLLESIFRGLGEEIKSLVITRMMLYIINAMNCLELDVRLMALKFLDLVVLSYPSGTYVHADKVLGNFVGILQNHHVFLNDTNALKDALDVLVHYLSALSSEKEKMKPSAKLDSLQNTSCGGTLHSYLGQMPGGVADTGMSTISMDIQKIVPALVIYWHEIIQLKSLESKDDAKAYDCMLCILRSIGLLVKIALADGVCVADLVLTFEKGSFKKKSYSLLELMEEVFDPYFSITKGSDHHFAICSMLVEVFMLLNKWIEFNRCPPHNFLYFIGDVLHYKVVASSDMLGEMSSDNKVLTRISTQPLELLEKHFLSCISYIPDLAVHVTPDWRHHLVEGLTHIFTDPEAKLALKLACMSSMKHMLVNLFLMFRHESDSLCSIFQELEKWLHALPKLLVELGHEQPSSSEAVLHLYLNILQFFYVDAMDSSGSSFSEDLISFYGSVPLGESKVAWCPFLKLPKNCQELAVSCLYYLPSLSGSLIESLAHCCICHHLDSSLKLKIIGVLQSSFKAGRVSLDDHLSFLVSIISGSTGQSDSSDSQENSVDGTAALESQSNRSILHAINCCLKEMGDGNTILRILQPIILQKLSSSSHISRRCIYVRMIASLSYDLENLPEEILDTVGHSLAQYLVDATLATVFGEKVDHEASQFIEKRFTYYVIPCIMLISRSRRLLSMVAESLITLHGTENSSTKRVHSIVYIRAYLTKFLKFQPGLPTL